MEIRDGIPGLARGTIRPARPQRDASTASSWLVQVRPFVLPLACAMGLSLGGAALTGSRADAAAKPLRCDFDGDGKSDLAAGVPGDMKRRGAVNVQYSPEGLLEKGEHFLRPDNLPGVSKVDGRLGSALACGDFDGDGFADLAIGAPGEQDSSGAIVAVYGSASGLWDKHGTYLAQSNIDLGIIGPVEPGDRFGEALAVGDFNGDGWDDLAIGVPGESSPFPAETPGGPTGPNVLWVGMVHVVFGSAKGLMGPAQTFSPFTPGVCCFTEADASWSSLRRGAGGRRLRCRWPRRSRHRGAVRRRDAERREDGGVRGGRPHPPRREGYRPRAHRPGLPARGVAHRPDRATKLGAVRTGPRRRAVRRPSRRRSRDRRPVREAQRRLRRGFWTTTDTGRSTSPTSTAPGSSRARPPSSWTSPPARSRTLSSDGDRFGWALAAGNFDRRHDDDLAIGIPRNHTTIRRRTTG